MDPAVFVIENILRLLHRNRPGAGKVFVLDVHDALRLMTGERGEAALGPAAPKTPR